MHYRGAARADRAGRPTASSTATRPVALGFVTAARLAGKPLVYSSYPITPATDVLHELAKLKHFDVRTIQCEDEIAAMGSAIGAAFGGAFSLTGTSGPGICLKSEAIGLAIMLELPLVILNVQRGGPSTGLPTKTEQADLLQAFVGRNGESPIPILAPSSPADCFDVGHRGLPHRGAPHDARSSCSPTATWPTAPSRGGSRTSRIWSRSPSSIRTDPEGFQPYCRDEATLARPWAIPGTPGLEHRIGGLEKEDGTGNVSYDPENHERMCRLRAEKVERDRRLRARAAVDGPERRATCSCSAGAAPTAPCSTAVRRCRDKGPVGGPRCTCAT